MESMPSDQQKEKGYKKYGLECHKSTTLLCFKVYKAMMEIEFCV